MRVKGGCLETSSVRVLVVDDYEPFRRFICSMLRKRPELQIVGETADGLEAVHKAEELRPDLILLDVGLPTLNGIEAARRIRTLSPESKIIFISQQSDPDVVEEALNLGARGYVVKAQAASELLAAVDAVLEKRQFISGRRTGRGGSLRIEILYVPGCPNYLPTVERLQATPFASTVKTSNRIGRPYPA
jgi:CheY-like chemotaxis protein